MIEKFILRSYIEKFIEKLRKKLQKRIEELSRKSVKVLIRERRENLNFEKFVVFSTEKLAEKLSENLKFEEKEVTLASKKTVKKRE